MDICKKEKPRRVPSWTKATYVCMFPLRRPGEGELNDGKRSCLRSKGLKKYFPINGGVFSRTVEEVKAIDGVDFYINEGETLGLVGESGCGKTTVGRTILRLIEPTAGEILFNGEDIMCCRRDRMRALRHDMQIVFQDPNSSLNPRMLVKDIIAEPLMVNGMKTGQ